jgi:hypothetical protein
MPNAVYVELLEAERMGFTLKIRRMRGFEIDRIMLMSRDLLE